MCFVLYFYIMYIHNIYVNLNHVVTCICIAIHVFPELHL